MEKNIAWNFFDKNIISYASKIHFLSDTEEKFSHNKIKNISIKKNLVIPNAASDESSKKKI